MTKKQKIKSGNKTRDQKFSGSEQVKATHSEESGGQFLRNPFVLQIFFILIFIITGITIYSNTLDSPFVLDDLRIIEENPTIRLTELTGKNILSSATGLSSNRPVSTLTFALNYYFDRYNPAGYHFVNIAIHILNAIILFFFLKLTFSIARNQNLSDLNYGPSTGLWISFFAALVWLVHPIQTQSVTYIVQRMNSMGATFFILALLCYAKGRTTQSRRRYLWHTAGAVSGLLALGSKESTAVLPFFILLYEWYFFQDLRTKNLKVCLKYLIPIICLFGLIAFLYLGIDPWEKLKNLHDFKNNEFTLIERILTQFRVVVYYISLIFFPHPSRLNLDYDFTLSHSLIDPFTTLLSMLVIIGLITLSIYLARKNRLISFCILWFLGNLAIESSVIPLAIIFEHRVYLPSMMSFIVPIILGYRYFKLRWLKFGFLSITVVIFSLWTYQRNNVWEDKVTLWRDVVKKSPNKARPNFNLGAALTEQERDQEAITYYKRALDLNPDLEQPHINLGEALERQGKMDEALAHYRTALGLKPELPEALNNIGGILAKQGQTDEAIRYFQKALDIRPHFALANFNLARALTAKGNLDAAIKHYYIALDIQPTYAEAHIKLGNLFLSLGEREKSINHYMAALQLDPGWVEAYNNLGIALMREGKIEAAIGQFQKALDVKPDFTKAQNNLERAMAIRKGLEDEISRLQALLKDSPESAELHFEIGNLYFRKGDQKMAMRKYKKALQLNPKFVPAINNLALVTAANQEYYKALTIFSDVLNYWPDDAETHYNIACMYARLRRVDESIEWLKKAIDKGYTNWESIKRDGDLDNIRDSLAYKALIKNH
jgi:tetratricopeptide (TPR) repeat protein